MFHVARIILLLLTLQGMLHIGNTKDCSGGKVSNQVWYDSDCKKCICDNGKIECTNSCKSKKIEKGSSHIVREMKSSFEYTCTHDNIKRRDNESWHETGKHAKSLKSKGECMQCHCNKQIVTCTIRKCPVITCKKKAIRKYGSCCLSCPDKKTTQKVKLPEQPVCYQSGSTFEKEASWKMYVPVKKGHGHCLRCRCNKHEESTLRHVCTRHQCPPLTCDNPIGKPGRCCGICRESSKRTRRTEGPTKITAKKKLNSMMLDIFKAIHERLTPSKKQGDIITHPVGMNLSMKRIKKGKKDCAFGMRKIYKHGEQFIPVISSCLRCHCQNALIKCGKIVCPTSYECEKPTYQPGLCCKVCPGVPVMKAQQLEAKNIVRIIKKSNGCNRPRADYIHVYQYDPEEKASSRFNSFYLFNRVNRMKPSEMHAWQLVGDKTTVRVATIEDVKPLLSRSKYLGYIKERILKRIHRHERELKGIRGRVKSILKISSMKKIISEKVRKKRHCKLSTGILDTSSVLKTLQEVD